MVPPKSVTFENFVTVHLIPTRADYPEGIARNIWTNREEMRQNAYRNTLEFSFEQFDWTQVFEEKDMVWIAGELIHPAHAIVLEHRRVECSNSNSRQDFFRALSRRRACSTF